MGKSVWRSWFLSYLFMLGLAICFSVAIYFFSFEIVQEQSGRMNQMLIDKLRVEVDGYMSEVTTLQENLLMDYNVQKITAIKHLKLADQETLLDLYKEIQADYAASNYVNDIFLYLNNLNTVISINGHMDSHLFYDLYYKNEANTYENFTEMMGKEWGWKVVPLFDVYGERELTFLKTTLVYGMGSNMATLAVTVKEERFRQWFENTKWDESMEIFMLDQSSQIYGGEPDFRPGTELVYGKLKPNEEVNIGGTTYRLSSSKSENQSWEYVLLSPVSLFEEGARRIQMFTFVGVGLCMTLGILAAYFLSHKNYHPLQQVMEQFQAADSVSEEQVGNEYQWLIKKANRIQHEKQGSRKLLKRHYLYRLVTRPWLEQNEQEDPKQLGIRLEHKWNLVLLLLPFEESLGERDLPHMAPLSRFIIENIFEEAIGQWGQTEFVDVGEAVACIINREELQEDTREYLENVAYEVQKKIQEWFHFQMLIFAGSFERGLEGVYTSYGHASETSGYQNLLGGQELIWYEDIKNRRLTYEYSIEDEQKILNALRTGDARHSGEYIGHVLDHYDENPIASAESRNYLVYDLLGTLLRGADMSGLNWSPGDYAREERLSYKLPTSVLKVRFEELANQICRQIQEREAEGHRDKQFGLHVMEYVKMHYQDPDLNISMTALNFEMTPTYLSALFKEQTEAGLLEYINQVRIDRAKELLNEGHPVGDVALETGFRNSGAFIRVFKKTTGITPGQMKKIT